MLWWTLRQLKSTSPARRADAARKAGAPRNKSAIGDLISALEDEDVTVRAAAAEALGKIGDHRAAEALGKLFDARRGKSENRRVDSLDDRLAAIRALSQLGPPALQQLLQALKSDDRELRKSAAISLGSLGCAEAIGPLVERLDDPRSQVRQVAAQALGSLGGSDALRGLGRAVAHRDPETRRTAVEVLGRIGTKDAVEPLSRAIQDSDEAVQIAAIDALKAIGGIDAGFALKPALEGGKKSVRAAAASALRGMPLEASNPKERAAIAVLCGDFTAAVREGDAAVDALVEALGSSNSGTRTLASEALGQLKAQRGAPALAKLLRDQDASVGLAAATALVTIGVEAVPVLLEALASASESSQRLAAQALGRIGDIRAVGPLVESIRQNREATPSHPEPLAIAGAARDALLAIIGASAASIPQVELEAASEVPDSLLNRQTGDDEQSLTLEKGLDCAALRDVARAELKRR